METGAFFYVLLLFFIFSQRLHAFSCDNVDLSTKFSCYSPPGNGSKTSSKRPIEWHRLNKNNITVEVSFDLFLHKNYSSYNILLTVSESAQHFEQCIHDLNYHHHTKLEYDRFFQKTNKTDSLCKERLTVQFTNIFTGCYHVSIEYKKQGNTDDVRQSYQFFQTYEKKRIEKPAVSSQYRASDQTLILRLTSSLVPSNRKFNLELADATTSQTITDHTFVRIGNGFEICETRTSSSDATECKLDKTTSDTVECSVKNVLQGTYSLMIEFVDPLKCFSELWGECDWQINITTDATVSLPVSEGSIGGTEDSKVKVAIICGLISVLLLLTIIAALFWVRLKKNSSISGSLVPDRERSSMLGRNPDKTVPHVLLLYARDIPQFMDTMSALRDLISAVGQCDVYDIFDENRFEEIAEDQYNWLREKLQNDFYKTTLIETYCGFLQSGIPSKIISPYREKHCFDDLFPYAVRQLIEIKNLHSYTKLFVANLAYDNYDYKSYDVLNPYTRYQIPTNLETLLSHLLGWTDYKPPYQNTIEFKRFMEKYRTLKTFYKNHPDYLKDVLNVEVQYDI